MWCLRDQADQLNVPANVAKTGVHLLQNEAPLPASLTVLQLKTHYYVKLRDLTRGPDRLSMAAGPVLILNDAIGGSLERETQHGQSQDTAQASRLVSTLPAGFSALELRDAGAIHIHCSAGLRRRTAAAVAEQLLLFFANAPSSYRQFSLCFKDSRHCCLSLSWPLDAMDPEDPNGSTSAPFASLDANNVEALAGHLRSSAMMHNVSIDVVGGPASIFNGAATLVLRRV